MSHLTLYLLMFALALTGAIAWFGHSEIVADLRFCSVPADRAGRAFCVLSEHAAADVSHETQSTTQSGVAPKETLTRNAFFPRYGAIKRSCKSADACGQYWTKALGEPLSGTAVVTRRLERGTNQKVNSRPIRAETAAQSNSRGWSNNPRFPYLGWGGTDCRAGCPSRRQCA